MLSHTQISLSSRAFGGVRRIAAVALVAGAALVGATLTAGPASADSPVRFPHHGPISLNGGKTYPAGTYIVQLRGAPASTYTGGVSGYARTRPTRGKQLNAHSSAVKSYTGHLAATSRSVVAAHGIHALHTYTVAYNGFAANLTSAQATALAVDKHVLQLSKDRVLKVQDDNLTSKSSLNYLGVADTSAQPGGNAGVWASIGGHDNAGKGIVVGDIDTGISPENPSFAGDPLGTTPSTGSDAVPYLNGSTITYNKADTGTFHSTEVGTADHWDNGDYSTKIIGAQAFDSGWLASNSTKTKPCVSADASTKHPLNILNCIAPNPVFENGILQPGDYVSPRDGDDHGSHTASTAAGNYGVSATVSGTNYGTISGVAPAAKIASYKACWSAPDPDNDGCDETDLVAAIEQATTDGVDVINFSIGGDSAATIYSPTDEAFLNASAAGIFVSAAGGNSGPGASTLDNASPWETTVAASTIPNYEATAQLGNGKEYAGASITVPGVVAPGSPAGTAVTNASLVLATAVKASNVTSAHAIDCRKGSLSATKTAGKVVVCDRDGLVDRVEMSATVKAAGGVGAIIVNTNAGDIDLDQHSVPTIHIDQPSRTAIRAYAGTKGATVTFLPTNAIADADPTKATPVPQIAGFSSRGPVQAGKEDTLKPDVAAPGVSILAAYADAPATDGAPLTAQWGFDSGTSMATPHITGLAALYLSANEGANATATPAEIKSALMTSATPTVDSKGAPVTDPFAQGAGEANPSAYLNPGLVYLAGVNDWKSYVQGTGEFLFGGVDPIDPSDLNQASIAIGALAGSQTVTRTVTAKTAGTYTETQVAPPGVTMTVTPDHFTIAAGATQAFTVKFTRTTAAFKKFTTGSLTWTNGGTTVRSPIAVQPTTAPPATAHGTGTNGVTTVDTSLGTTKSTSLHLYGLAAQTAWPDPTDIFENPATHFAQGSTIDSDGFSELDQANGYLYHETSSVNYVKFAENPTDSDTSNTDLDLYVLYKKTFSTNLGKYKTIAASATPSAAESVSLSHPKSGYYVVIVDPYAVPTGGADFVQSNYTVKSGQSGHFNSSVSSLKGSKTGVQSYRLGWGGLEANTSYLGLVRYGSGSAKTLVNVDTGDATDPISVTAPAVTGTGAVGSKLTASGGTWNVSTKYLGLTYQWQKDGTDIGSATASTYTPVATDVSHALSVVVTAHLGGDTSVPSNSVTGKVASTTTFTIADKTISTKVHAALTVHVVLNPVAAPDATPGTITVKDGSKVLVITEDSDGIADGTDTVTLPLLKKGSHHITVTYSGDDGTVGSSAKSQTIKVS